MRGMRRDPIPVERPPAAETSVSPVRPTPPSAAAPAAGRSRTFETRDALRLVKAIGALDVGIRPAWKVVVDITRKDPEMAPGWTRQRLDKHPLVKSAYLQAMKAWRDGRSRRSPTSGRSARTLDGIQAEMLVAKGRIRELEARMATWLHNAHLHHVTIEQLDAPLL